MSIDHSPLFYDAPVDLGAAIEKRGTSRKLRLGRGMAYAAIDGSAAREQDTEEPRWPVQAAHFLAEVGQRELLEAVTPVDAAPLADALVALRGKIPYSKRHIDPRERVLGRLRGKSELAMLEDEGDIYGTPKALRRWFTDFASVISSSYEHADILGYVTASVAAGHDHSERPALPEVLPTSPLAQKPSKDGYDGVIVPVLQRRQHRQLDAAARLPVDMFAVAAGKDLISMEQWMAARKQVIAKAVLRGLVTPPQGTAIVRRLELRPDAPDCSEEVLDGALESLRGRFKNMRAATRLRREAGPILRTTQLFLDSPDRTPSIDEMQPHLQADYPAESVNRYWVARRVYGGLSEVMGLNKPEPKL